jgi:hypothetical protein
VLFLYLRHPLPMFRRAIVLLCLGLLSCEALAAGTDYLKELVERSRAQRLADRKEWRDLLHYKSHPLWFGARSLADDPGFFNAAEGKSDPGAELAGTLAAFFADVEESDTRQHPQCRFIARYHWLKRELAFDAARLAEQPCARFGAWRAGLNPQSLTLVFAADFLNSPGSMYGHTLLRVDAGDQDERTRLLAYSVSYAAATEESSGLVFAVKGLFGGYPGVFSMVPYYIKVREYSDLENRDVWEYELDLSPEEIERLLMHAWELGPTKFDYYFFDENCAYHLLSLFDVARPSLGLTDSFRWWATPSDTVRAVVAQPGLLRRTVYRPSGATKLRHGIALASEPERRLARDIVQHGRASADVRLASLPAARQAAVLELAYEYLDYERLSGRFPQQGAVALGQDLLLARSRVPHEGTWSAPPVPAERPDQGHGTTRLGLAAGVRDQRHFSELSWRGTYHDLLDPEPGYSRGAELAFFDIAARHSSEEGVRLETFRPLDIVSLSGRDEFFRPTSWKVNLGWTRERMPSGERPLVFRANGGPGLAWDSPGPFALRSLYFGFVEVTGDIDGQLEHGYAVGAGPALGWIADVLPAWRARLSARTQWYFLGDTHRDAGLRLEQRWHVTRASAVRLDLARKREFDTSWNEARLTWHVYY